MVDWLVGWFGFCFCFGLICLSFSVGLFFVSLFCFVFWFSL